MGRRGRALGVVAAGVIGVLIIVKGLLALG
jgi:hypothetical protein